jgi:AhpD family alkylhydroperoxidase
MNQNAADLYQELEKGFERLGAELPGPMSGFNRLHNKAVETKALDKKTKELMALAIGIAVHCEGCIAYHTHDAAAAGATWEELMETIGVAVMMGGGPAAVYAVKALNAAQAFCPENRSELPKAG